MSPSATQRYTGFGVECRWRYRNHVLAVSRPIADVASAVAINYLIAYSQPLVEVLLAGDEDERANQ